MIFLDRNPGAPRILFIGIPYSTHTQSWIDLLKDSTYNIQLFSVQDGYPPADWWAPTYLTTLYPPEKLNTKIRQSLHPIPEAWYAYDEACSRGNSAIQIPKPQAESAEAWLAEIIQDWRPDVIHTLGLDPAGYFFDSVRSKYELGEYYGKWVVQLRGGSDLALTHLDPETFKKISPILLECDQIVSDNLVNLEYARSTGCREEQFSILNPIPGTGGIDIELLQGISSAYGKPSSRNLILWPKSYETIWSKAVPVLEALRLAWPDLPQCTVQLLAANSETRGWYNALPAQIKARCQISGGVPRMTVLELMAQARVVLGPSLVDGVPNILYEAMATGSFPIVSPLETIMPVVRNEKNVLFARNLYPEEIATALIRAMKDDDLVDRASSENLELVSKLADRSRLKPKVVAYYESLIEEPGTMFRALSVGKLSDQPLISVFTSCHNQGAFLGEAIDSVLNQTYPNFEYILIDDGSADNSWEVIQEYAKKDSRIRPIKLDKQANVGVVINESISKSRGTIWTWCPSDDVWLPDLLSTKLEFSQKQAFPSVFYSDWQQIDDKGQVLENRQPIPLTPKDFQYEVWFTSPIGFTGIWIPVDFFKTAGPFPKHLDFSEDFYWMIKATIHNIPFIHIPEILYKKRIHTNRLSHRFSNEINANVNKIRTDLWYYSLALNPPQISNLLKEKLFEYASRNANRVGMNKYILDVIGKRPFFGFDSKTIETLDELINSQDLGQAILEHASEINPDLVSLVRVNAGTARLDGHDELASNLDLLANFIDQWIKSGAFVERDIPLW